MVTVCDPVSSKVIDAEVVSKCCNACKGGENKNNCDCNFYTKGPGSTAMEPKGAKTIFLRSVDKYNLI